jgi:hypothetical protein
MVTVLDLSNTGIVSSNQTRGMDVYSRFSVLCCLQRTDPQFKEY